MSVSAATLRKLIDAGLSGDALIDVVESIEADHEAPQRSASAERQARYRARKNNQNVTSDVTRDVTDGDAKKEKNQKKKTTPLGYTPKGDISSSPQGGIKKRACRIPPDWNPDRDYAEAKGLSSQQIDTEAEKFRNYWQSASGQRATKTDWPATWRNWVLNAVDRQPRGHSPPNRAAEREQATNDSFARVERELAEASEQGDLSSVFAPSRYQN
jgi:hypothetical protein